MTAPNLDGLWRPANSGANKMRWFLIRETPGAAQFRDGADGRLVRYGSYEAARKAADRLNRDQPAPNLAVLVELYRIALQGMSGEEVAHEAARDAELEYRLAESHKVTAVTS